MTLRNRQVRDSDLRPHFSEVSSQDTSLAGHMQVLSAQSRSLIRWDQFEAMAGLVAAFLLAFGPLTVAALALVISLLLAEWEVAGVAAIVVAVTCPMALWLTRMAESALNEFRTGWPAYTGKCSSADCPTAQRRPAFAMLLAAQLSPLPFIARFPLAVWWLAHFAAGTGLVMFADELARQGLIWNGFVNGVPAVVYSYLFNFAANIFLVLAVTTGLGSPRVTAGVWRNRFAIDGLFALPLFLRIVL